MHLSHMRAAKVQTSLRKCAVSSAPLSLAHTQVETLMKAQATMD